MDAIPAVRRPRPLEIPPSSRVSEASACVPRNLRCDAGARTGERNIPCTWLWFLSGLCEEYVRSEAAQCGFHPTPLDELLK